MDVAEDRRIADLEALPRGSGLSGAGIPRYVSSSSKVLGSPKAVSSV